MYLCNERICCRGGLKLYLFIDYWKWKDIDIVINEVRCD